MWLASIETVKKREENRIWLKINWMKWGKAKLSVSIILVFFVVFLLSIYLICSLFNIFTRTYEKEVYDSGEEEKERTRNEKKEQEMKRKKANFFC